MSIIKNISQIFLCIGLVLSAPQGFAEDIDIYARPPDTSPNAALNPNVLIVIDNSANWASAAQHWPGGIKQGESELNALRTVIGELTDRTNVGLMMFTEGTGTNKNGGYIRFHVRQMTPTNKSAFSELVGFPSGCTDGPNSLNGTPNCIQKNFNGSEKTASAKTDYSASMLEVFKYFGGYTHPAHAQDDVAGANVNSSQFGTLRYAGDFGAANIGMFDAAAYTDALKTNYNSPLSSTNSCAKNYVIFIGNGFPSQDSPSTLLGPPSLLPAQGVGGDVTQLPLANLSTTSTTQSVLLATPACGTYPGADITTSTAACNAVTTFSTTYPGYSSYACTYNSTCTAGSTTTTTTVIGTSACGVYASAAACQAAVAVAHPGYTSTTCTNQTACTSTSSNPTNPLTASTGCITDNLSNATNCTAYGAAHYPSYSGFSCTGSNCSPNVGGSKQWRIDATTLITSGNTYSMNGISTTTVTGSSYSQNITGTYTTTAATPNGTFSAPAAAKINYFDEWARFLHRTDVSPAVGQQNISTFTIDVFKDQQDTNESSLLISAASTGGGKYFKASDETAITNALRKIFSEIQSVNSVFASSSLPVSVNTQGTYLNQVFMGMFRPEANAAPRWPGNLKQFQFAVLNGKLQLADKYGDAAISTVTGFVTPCSDSFWTTDTGQYWNFGTALALGDCSAQASAYPVAGSTSVYSDAPDGEVVEKGGAAQRLRGVSGAVTTSTNYNVCGAATPSTASCRKLLTCDGSSATSCTSFTNFDTSNASVTGALSTNLIWWTRGKDVDNENANLDAGLAPILNEMRPSVHGGVVHSQPAVIDYGGTTGTIAFYGADDGVFHAVDGGQTDTEGIELWGFIPPEGFGKLYRLRDNGSDSDGDGITSALIAFPSITGSPAPLPKDYFFDGSIGVFQRLGTVWIYSSMRRGGRAVYAFDVSDPFNPVLKWRKGCFTSDTTNDTMCSAGWSGIGQTWSHPMVAYISGYMSGGLPKPVLVFGGGYDQCEDTDSKTRCTTTPRKGANIWFVDADTGAIIRTYPTNYSVPGDLSILKDVDGYMTSVYASDSGGYVYRINVGSYDGATFGFWTANTAAADTLIASLSDSNNARKFLEGPTVVPSPGFNAVLIGSGDREHPLVNSYACNYMATSPLGSFVTNQFYMLMDQPTGYPSPTPTTSSLVDVTSGTTTTVTASGITTITNVTGGVTTTSTQGWRFNFGTCEQSVNTGLTIGGITNFGTNTPSPGGTSCVANLGTARGYAVEYLTGNATSTSGGNRSAIYVGGGMPPSPVAGVVDVGGTKYPFCIGCIDTTSANSSALQGSEVVINPTGSRYRSYWYMESD